MTYQLIKVFNGWQVQCDDGKNKMYLQSVYKGKYRWVTDYTYGKHYSLKVAAKHIHILSMREKMR